MILRFLVCLVAGLSVTLAGRDIAAQTVWNGPSVFFEKASFADPTLEENQDRITESVWLTRGDSQGLFNAAQEPSYNQFTATPFDTEWTDGTTADLGSLSFTTWLEWAKGNNQGGQGLFIENRPAVVHLITDDIYIDIEFLSWQAGLAGSNVGGGFSYVRSSAVPEPSTLALLAALPALAPRRRRR